MPRRAEVRQMLLGLAALLAWWAAVPAAAQGALTHYYCFAPDPATGTVHVGPIMPVGPMGERASYGARFADELQARRVTGIKLQAYCTMRPGLAQIRNSKQALPQESCPFCAGATRFAEVPWSRDAILPPPAPAAPVPVRARGTPALTPGVPDAVPAGPMIVVLGNSETGEVVSGVRRAEDGLDLLRTVREQAWRVRESGWQTLLVSNEPGVGMATCLKDGDNWRFFVAHSPDSQGLRQAKADAAAEAALVEARAGITAVRCGKPWAANGILSEDRPTSAVDIVKGLIRKCVTGKPPPPNCRRAVKAPNACMCVRG